MLAEVGEFGGVGDGKWMGRVGGRRDRLDEVEGIAGRERKGGHTALFISSKCCWCAAAVNLAIASASALDEGVSLVAHGS